MKVTRFLHTAIPTVPYDNVYDFYTRVLGMKPAPRPDIPTIPGAWLGVEGRSDEVQVHVIGNQPNGPDFEATRVHFALGVESLEEAKKTLDAEGITYSVVGGMIGASQLFLRDPVGNIIELQEAP